MFQNRPAVIFQSGKLCCSDKLQCAGSLHQFLQLAAMLTAGMGNLAGLQHKVNGSSKQIQGCSHVGGPASDDNSTLNDPEEPVPS